MCWPGREGRLLDANGRYLIVNADDFGRSPGINRGVIEAHEGGIVTSASLMVRWQAAAEAAAYGREHRSLGLGLHFDLGEWAYRDGTWVPVYEVAPTDVVTAVTAEWARQLASFRHLVGRDPTHIDSHQHVHLREPVRSVLTQAARDLAVPLRHCSPGVRYCGDFYGQTATGLPLHDAISVGGLTEILTALPPGVTELGCHPGLGIDSGSAYGVERAEEVKTLCDPRVRTAIVGKGIELCPFGSGTLRPMNLVP